MRNRVYFILTGIVCLGIVLACEVPQSVTIKGSPGIYTNLGSPFGKDNTLLDVLNGDGVEKRLGEGNGRTYTYTGDTTVKTYLISFPLIPAAPATTGVQVTETGDIPNLSLHEIADFLGGVQFKEVPAYLYISGLTTTSKMSLSSEISGQTTTLLNDVFIDTPNKFQLSKFEDLADGVEMWSVPITAVHTVSLKEVFNAKSKVTLKYTITGTTDGNPLKADLVVKLPLRFTPPPGAETIEAAEGTFVQLNLDALPKEDEDLFGRTNDGGDDLFSQLDWVKIDIQPVDNNSIDNLYLGMIRKSGNHSALSLDNRNDPGPEQFLDGELAWPFNPIRLLMRGSGEDLIVNPTPKGTATFDFQIAVEAKTKLNIKF
ncbi:hypothetical protein AGMMS49942_23880 [Spirochaetia bacterium]|nr:hypothetical protein AGMMS49942_23880 [Spirochaetia bacterium]